MKVIEALQNIAKGLKRNEWKCSVSLVLNVGVVLLIYPEIEVITK